LLPRRSDRSCSREHGSDRRRGVWYDALVAAAIRLRTRVSTAAIDDGLALVAAAIRQFVLA
jgi:hypothetical protein